jgi:hypothetical protein
VVPLSAFAPVYAYSVATVSVAPPELFEDELAQAASTTDIAAAIQPAAARDKPGFTSPTTSDPPPDLRFR